MHFNVQPVGHFIVLQSKDGEKDKHYNKLLSVHFIHLHTQTKNASTYSTQCLVTTARENHTRHFKSESEYTFLYILIYVYYVLRNVDVLVM